MIDETFMDKRKQAVDGALEFFMPPEGTHPARLVAAMRYSLFAGGKRIRPILTLTASEAAGGRMEDGLVPGCAVELVHTYSLIHDDLPAMDNDDFRRGSATCHKAFDESTAILAGDALLTMAFDLLSTGEMNVSEHVRLRMVQELSRAAGWRGMVGGQQVDMDSEGMMDSQNVHQADHAVRRELGWGWNQADSLRLEGESRRWRDREMARRDFLRGYQGTVPELPVLEYIHTHKTGALVRCSVILGALAAGAGEEVLRAFNTYGEKVGLAFQVVDDILDVIASTEEMGKDQGSDAARGKITYPAIYGLEGARERAFQLIEDAKAAVADVDPTGHLSGIADFVLLRRL
ncbi:MAG: polyprenyl synthetase family protein [bacterium]|nr:polyprenyl synthetase family protein [bacterium]MDT8395868.1 polyprenyl synthetase family protein [bacterium]